MPPAGRGGLGRDHRTILRVDLGRGQRAQYPWPCGGYSQLGRAGPANSAERALARWLTSAPAAALPLPRRQQVTIEIRERNGRECAAVTALDGEILALYRVTRSAARLRLVESAPGTAEPPTPLSRSLALQANSSATRAQSRALRARSVALLGRARSARTAASATAGRSHALRAAFDWQLDARLLPESALARMRPQLETMPIIEQAKGILIARTGCDPSEAFDQLRAASQRANVPVRDLAARLVEQSISRDRADDLRSR